MDDELRKMLRKKELLIKKVRSAFLEIRPRGKKGKGDTHEK